MNYIMVALPGVKREKEVVGIKEKGKKRHIPREAANVGILKDQRMNPVWPKKASVYQLKNVQEIRTPKVDSNRV